MAFVPDEPTGRFVPDERRAAPAAPSLAEQVRGAYIEPPLALATGAAGAIAGGWAGLGQSVKNLFSEGMPAGERVRQVQDAMTYQPRTGAGQAVTNVASYIPEQIAKAGDYAGGVTTDIAGKVFRPETAAVLGAGVNTGIQAAPSLLLRGLKPVAANIAAKSDQRAADLKSINSVKDQTIKDARERGYVFPQSEIEGSFIGNKVESLGGKAATAQEANRRNQAVSDKIGREEAGLAPNEPLDKPTLAAARDRIAAPYREVTNASPAAAQALEKVRALRNEAHGEWDHFAVSRDPAVKAKAKALDAEALRQEGIIDMEATRLGIPGLLDRVRQARKELAKNYDVERALNLGDGHVDARVWGRMLDRDKPLSDGLRVAARTAEAMDRFMKAESSTPSPGVSKLHWPLAGALALGGHATLGPAGALMGLLPLLDGPARSLALSKLMQKPRTYGPGTLSEVMSGATSDQATGLAALLQAQQRP